MCPVLVFGSVGGVAKGFGAAGVFAHIRLFSGVRPEMSLQVFESTVSFAAALESAFVRLLARVATHVDDEHVLRLRNDMK